MANMGSSCLIFQDVQSSNTASWPAFSGVERARESFSSRGQCFVTSQASSLNFCCSNVQSTSNMALEQCSTKYASPIMSWCPRVFCMGKSGYLLLSNTGLLGIVCSCHCCHMSVLKFCEHSGLYGVNPGDAVRIESGETIAQWQKLYFLKFGIRSPGNGSEWDWPEVVPTGGNLMKFNASASDVSKSDLSHILSSAAVTLRKQPIIIQDGCNIPLKGINAIIQNKQYPRANSQLMETDLAICKTAPNFVGAQLDDGFQPITPFLDSRKRNGNLPNTHSTSQIPTSLLKDHEYIKKKNAKDVLAGKDATSSNIELRLGQPPRERIPVRSFTESPLFTCVSPPKLQSLKQMTNIADLSREDVLQNSFRHAAGSFKMLVEQPQLKPMNYVSGVSNASGAATASSQTVNVTKSSSLLPFPQYNAQPKGKTKLFENLVNDGIIPKKLYSEYGNIQFGPTNVPWNTNGHTERQSNDFAPGSKLSNKFMGIDNGVNFAKDSCTKTYSGYGASQLMEFGSITRTAGDNGSCIPVVSGKIYESSFASDTSVGAKVLHGPKNVSSFGQDNHSTLGKAVPFEGVSKSLPYLVSSSTPNLNPTSVQRQSNMDTYMLDENMRLLALTQILELSKQHHALYFRDMNQKQGKSENITKTQNYICKASVPEQGTSGASSKLPQNEGTCGILEITDDLNRYCHLSALTAIPLHSKEKELQCKRSYDLQNDGQSLSLGMNNSRTGKCSEQPSDIQFVGKYTSAARANGCGSNFCTGIDPSRDILKKQIADAIGVTSLKIVSECSRDQNASKEENIYFEPGGNLDGQGRVKIGSHTPQWKDVPSKVSKSFCDAIYLDRVSTVLDCEGQDSVGNIPAKRMKKTMYREDMLKEQEIFNVSSECSAHVVSQTSVMEVNKVDSCTVDATDTGYVENLVIDEGSGIDKGWSSDVVESERSAEFPGSTSGSYLKKGNPGVVNDQPCRSLLDELKLLDSLIWKKGRDQNHIILATNNKTNQSEKVKKGFKDKKRKRNEATVLDASLVPGIPSSLNNQNGESAGASDSPSSLSEEMLLYFSSSLQRSSNRDSIVQFSTKQGPSAFSSKFVSCKNHLSKHHNDRDSYESESNSDAEFHTLPGISRLRKLKSDFTSVCSGHFKTQEPSYEEPKNALQRSSSSRKASPIRIKRPVVCGMYGEISSESLTREVPKPVKIFSLSKVLKTSKRCMVPTIEKPNTKKKWRRLTFGTSSGHCCQKRGSKAKEDNEFQDTIICDQTKSNASTQIFEIGSKRNVIYKWKRDTKVSHGDIVNRADVPVKVKSKEIQKQRSINEITAKENKVQELLKYADDEEDGLCNTKSENSIQEQANICCVCQSSSNDKINSLLECSRCLIKVHQACYGVSTLPKRGRWCCRPCQTNSKDIACVLCGYGGGAMTRALSSHSIVKSLLKVWNFEKDNVPKHAISRGIFGEEVDASHSSETGWVVDLECALSPENVSTSKNLSRIEMSTNHIPHTPCFVSNIKVKNSIIAGILDSTVKQWVHLVCGLWTPGTRCPNVDTMSAFDVSGVSRPKADVVCSICNRWGGFCIECSIVDCSVKFHPWCAHQKNLLQGETEGVNDENIGFYGRCLLHAIGPKCQSTYDPIDEMGSREEKEFTCARTEGYRGRRCDGFQNNPHSALKPRGGCLVPEEQLNAWKHINGQKLCSPGIPKFPDLDIDHDCRKEYARYKQVKGWKHLVVYKSGIHALGLYTSQFISQGRMVVEYIGEIVGLRVADKRENEYQSGRKFQYKSACYFFRIDKEHIIDATRKGGIARFVNHSCLPNCVAKVITVRHEKKVVFFAERDIFPGEEITYDYHFNHEDEGKKIPCYCNSKNCRRYLN